MSECPNGPHRPPQGPNEDVAVCLRCYSLSHEMRPEGETYGDHIPDCSLPIRHKSYCKPGGKGHPKAATIRGFWPEQERLEYQPMSDEVKIIMCQVDESVGQDEGDGHWVCYDGPDHCDCDRAKEAGVCCNCRTPLDREQTLP